ncbi:MAG TPA: lysophospholipid acyltransferase family protein [Pyrinomonadaceae bacterium]|nr:lysophospholipid acyltransferase family protein [Pyrinomonadaceae bacterium]
MTTRRRILRSGGFLLASSFLMLVVATPTLFLARRFYSELIARWMGRTILRIWGINYATHYSEPLPDRQTIYISNHTSTLDVFLLISLGLPRARFFLSGSLRKFPPVLIVGYVTRMFWTVPQEFQEQRRQIFRRADRILRRTGDSVYLSPEGKCVTTGKIGSFNKGSFHLATSLKAPIVPMYVHIPAQVQGWRGYRAQPGTVQVYFLPAIDTSSWRLEDLEANRDRVRGLYLRVHDAIGADGRLPKDLGIEPLQSERVMRAAL